MSYTKVSFWKKWRATLIRPSLSSATQILSTVCDRAATKAFARKRLSAKFIHVTPMTFKFAKFAKYVKTIRSAVVVILVTLLYKN